jgi:hypothetical protein
MSVTWGYNKHYPFMKQQAEENNTEIAAQNKVH